jgi:antitoxin MazE
MHRNYRMPVETLKVVRIGNSRGVRIPARLLAQYRIRDTVEVECTAAGIVLRPKRDGRLSWDETFLALREEQDRKGDEFADLDAAAGDGLASLDR